MKLKPLAPTFVDTVRFAVFLVGPFGSKKSREHESWFQRIYQKNFKLLGSGATLRRRLVPVVAPFEVQPGPSLAVKWRGPPPKVGMAEAD